MASPADAIAYAANGGWDRATVMQVTYWLTHGEEPGNLTSQARGAIDAIGGMGLSGTGVNQLRFYLENGQPPPDLSYTDESASVLGVADPEPTTSPQSIPVTQAPDTPASITDAQRSARSIINSALDQWGLSGLGDKLWDQVLNGTPPDQIFRDLRTTPEYQARFPGMKQLVDKGAAITESEYIGIERGYRQVMRAAGLPEQMYDSPDDLGRFIGGEVSPAEFSQRVGTYVEAAYNAPAEVRGELERLYGIGPGHLAAFFMDDTKALPLIQNQFAASQRSAAATRTGFGGLSQTEAERLVATGVTDQQASEGFGQLAQRKELFSSLNSGEDAISRTDQLGATFDNNAAAQERIRRREARRKADFAGGGSFAGSKAGMSGIGASS